MLLSGSCVLLTFGGTEPRIRAGATYVVGWGAYPGESPEDDGTASPFAEPRA
jgi:hypothetical protein